MLTRVAVAMALAASVLGCGDNVTGDPVDEDELPLVYEFDSRFIPGQSSVAYNGQVFRQLLIAGYKAELASWTTEIDIDGVVKTAAEWREELDFYFRFDKATSLEVSIGLEFGAPLAQTTWGDISGGASLIEKIAGEDDVTDFRDWDGDGEPASALGGLVGWTDPTIGSPTMLVDSWIDTMAAAAEARATSIPVDPFGADIESVYVTPEGLDLRQLSQKFLTGAITFAQGTDDYLDSGTPGKGLDSSNLQDEDAAYSSLEHAWDEGFGYFGSTRSFAVDTSERRTADSVDADGNGTIDLKTEINTGMAANAAKRDFASADQDPTDFSGRISAAMIKGRHIIWLSAGEELSEEAMAALVIERDAVVNAWDEVFAATVIHYINEVRLEMSKIGNAAETYSFSEHAKFWGELKGFALAFQFNPRSKLSDADFAMLHLLLGDAPVITDVEADLLAYDDKLSTARDLIRESYGFSVANAENW